MSGNFKQKMEKYQNEEMRKEKKAKRELEIEKEKINKYSLTNKYTAYTVFFGSIGTVLTLWPAGFTTQMQWWYIVSILISGFLGYYFAIKASKLNDIFFKKYHVRLNEKSVKIGVYLSAFSLFGAVLIIMTMLQYYI